MKRLLTATVIAVLSLASSPLFAFGGPEVPLDEEIKSQIVDQLTWDSRVDASEITVEVELGLVTVGGTVPSGFTEDAVIDDVWSVEGVTAVENELNIETFGTLTGGMPLAEAIENAMLVDSSIESSDITVSADDGYVTLEGTVTPKTLSAPIWRTMSTGKLLITPPSTSQRSW